MNTFMKNIFLFFPIYFTNYEISNFSNNFFDIYEQFFLTLKKREEGWRSNFF